MIRFKKSRQRSIKVNLILIINRFFESLKKFAFKLNRSSDTGVSNLMHAKWYCESIKQLGFKGVKNVHENLVIFGFGHHHFDSFATKNIMEKRLDQNEGFGNW